MIATEHVRELAARKSSAFELLLALEENPHADEACFRGLAQVVDWIVSHPVSIDGGTLDGLRAFVKSESQDLGSSLPVLALALSEASHPERVRVLLANYPKWLNVVSSLARPHFLGILPNIAAHLDELEESGIDLLIARLNCCASGADCDILCGCVGRYQETSGSVVAAAAEIAGLAIRTDSRDLVDDLMTAVSPESMGDSKAAKELLPAMVQIKWAASSDSVWVAGIRVCVALAKSNHSSSALHLARHLEKSLAPLTGETQLAYLKSFQRMVEAAGISFLGYGTKRMPPLFQGAGGLRATEFVAQGMAIARRYGTVAAEAFLEQETGASQRASQLE